MDHIDRHNGRHADYGASPERRGYVGTPQYDIWTNFQSDKCSMAIQLDGPEGLLMAIIGVAGEPDQSAVLIRDPAWMRLEIVPGVWTFADGKLRGFIRITTPSGGKVQTSVGVIYDEINHGIAIFAQESQRSLDLINEIVRVAAQGNEPFTLRYSTGQEMDLIPTNGLSTALVKHPACLES